MKHKRFYYLFYSIILVSIVLALHSDAKPHFDQLRRNIRRGCNASFIRVNLSRYTDFH